MRNLARLEPLVAGADADVVVLPELFATGFTLDPAAVAETPGGAGCHGPAPLGRAIRQGRRGQRRHC